VNTQGILPHQRRGRRLVMLFHVDEEVEGEAKVLGATNELRSCVPSIL
jgi:hypothetical protein